ncbi:MAG TPA: FecR domain-containing protein [Candidatus Sulfotelmatobacter sp.]|jgi:transmembrane sensor|nr:FecR domain-containing protein [Candidatus Sulfotelmatobacter sp.]
MAESRLPIPDTVLQEAFDHLLHLCEQPDDILARRRLQRWLEQSSLHRQAWAKAKRTWDISNAMGSESRPSVLTWSLPVRPTLMMLAACLVLSLMMVCGLERGDLFSRPNEIREARLEDGSKVVMDGGSGLDVQFDDRQRNVALRRGEVFFDVAHDSDRPFRVRAGDVTVTVVGTQFDVRLDDEAVTVAVAGGRVRVANQSGEEAPPLQAGQAVRVERQSGAITAMSVEANDVAAFRDGKLVVDDATLAQVAQVLNRHYAGRLIILDDAMAEHRVTGVFDLRNPVSALRAAAAPYGGQVSEWAGFLGILKGG